MHIDSHGELSLGPLRPENIDRQAILTADTVALDGDQLLPWASTPLAMSCDRGTLSIPWTEPARINRTVRVWNGLRAPKPPIPHWRQRIGNPSKDLDRLRETIAHRRSDHRSLADRNSRAIEKDDILQRYR